jgi:hypothetical protein
MPQLRFELHDGRAERVVARNADVNDVLAALIRSVGRAHEGAPEVLEILLDDLKLDVRILVLHHVLYLLGNTLYSLRHVEGGTGGWQEESVMRWRGYQSVGKLGTRVAAPTARRC